MYFKVAAMPVLWLDAEAALQLQDRDRDCPVLINEANSFHSLTFSEHCTAGRFRC